MTHPLGSRWLTRFTLPFLALVALASIAPARAEELWKLDTGGDIVFQRLTPLGSLLVSTEMNLRAVDPETGKTLWMRDDVKKLKECNYDEITDTPYGLLDLGDGVGGTQRRVEVIDLETGQKKWDSSNLPMNSSQGLFQVPQKNMLLMMGMPKKGNKSVLVGVDIASGELKWQQDAVFTKPVQLFEVRGSGKLFKRMSVEGNQQPVFDTENTAVLYLTEEGPVKIDLSTGQKVWVADKLKGKEPPAPRNGYASIVKGEGVVFVPYGKSVQALDANSGAALWKEDHDFKSPVAQMQLVPQGLLVRGQPVMNDKGKMVGKPFIDLLDPKTGLSVWKKPFKDLDDATTFDVKGDQAYIAADGELFTIQLADGSSKSVAKYKFKGSEVPTTLEVVDGNYLLSSSQNMMMLDANGGQKYHCFYAAPGASGWAKLASTAAIMAVNAAAAGSAYSRAQATGETQHYTLITSNPTLSKRFKASSNALSYCSILTSIEDGGHKGPGLVKIEKASGKEAARVVLGDKTPEYEMDPIEGRVFFMKSEKEIVCYKF
jgi:outer membrane protein assembly factor BamB